MKFLSSNHGHKAQDVMAYSDGSIRLAFKEYKRHSVNFQYSFFYLKTIVG